MAFANPQTVTIGGTAHSLKRINQDNNGAVYQKIAAGLEIRMSLRNSYESKKADGSVMVRSNVELTHTTFDSNNVPTTTIAYAVVRWQRGKDPLVATNVLDALAVLVDAQSASIVDWDVGP